jgi:hypothetical protein
MDMITISGKSVCKYDRLSIAAFPVIHHDRCLNTYPAEIGYINIAGQAFTVFTTGGYDKDQAICQETIPNTIRSFSNFILYFIDP